MNVIQFNRAGPRAPHPLFGFLASVVGIHARDTVEQVTPSRARLNIDVSDAGDRAVHVDRQGRTLAVKATGLGIDDTLRRIHLGHNVRPVNHRRRGDVLEIDLTLAEDRDPPLPTAPAAAPMPRAA